MHGENATIPEAHARLVFFNFLGSFWNYICFPAGGTSALFLTTGGTSVFSLSRVIPDLPRVKARRFRAFRLYFVSPPPAGLVNVQFVPMRSKVRDAEVARFPLKFLRKFSPQIMALLIPRSCAPVSFFSRSSSCRAVSFGVIFS